MFDLLYIEWLKIKKYVTFWVLAGLFMVLLAMWNYLVAGGFLKLGTGDINILSTSYSFPAVWANVGFYTRLFSGLLAIIVIILATNEYQYRTNRQNVIDGQSRSQFLHAKWLLVLVMSMATTLFTMLVGICLALMNGSSMTDMADKLESIGYVFILGVNYFGFALTLSLLLKRSGMSIIIFLLYAYVFETIVSQVAKNVYHSELGNYLPMQCSANLLEFPMMSMAKNMIGQVNTGPTHTTLVLVSCAWIVIYYFLGRIKLLKSDW